VAAKTIRCVITGQADSGATVFAFDEQIEPTESAGGGRFWLVWGTDKLPVELPTDGQPVFAPTRFPWPNGARVSVTEFPAKGAEAATAVHPLSSKIPGDAGRTVTRDSKTGMHMTDTLDIAIILEGEVGLEQSDGVELVLRQGDVLIQNGGIHAWRPRDQPCRVAFVILGAERQPRVSSPEG
jgi:uncharacterized cupin superfamily protein